MSENLKNIKIPYPSEGVIRTAALDDTVAPTDSAQIAVNMNFDRIGAFQTRKGLTEYADDLDGEIKNFGTLNNSIIPPGYIKLTELGVHTFSDVTANSMSAAKIDDTHFILFWRGADNDGFVQVMELDLVTGDITAQGTPLEFETSDNHYNACIQVNATHFLNLWSGVSDHGFAQVFVVNTTTWAVTAVGSALEFDATLALTIAVAQVDTNHFAAFWDGAANGNAQILTVNLSTFAVTAEGSPLNFSSNGVDNSCVALGDGLHVINFWSGPSGDGFVQTFAVNTGTWAITAVGSALEFDTVDATRNSAASLDDGQHFINFWHGNNDGGYAQIFNVNPSTFAVTALGTALKFASDTGGNQHGVYNACVSAGDGQHFINFWTDINAGPINEGRVRIFEVNLSTFAVTASSDELSLGTISLVDYGVGLVTDSRVIGFWKTEIPTGVGSLFRLEGEVVSSDLLYAQQEDGDVLNWDGANWTTRRSGISNTQKARFTQFLNYIWMVNGNETIGDPVQTSNGGAFGTDLVPDDFPPGDYIQAGFEGRVWVADKLFDVVYFTDIVQFTPPDIYVLTYDPDTNFIKNFSPQNGQSITGLVTTPRALLLFKQDSIYRIYGAYSVDSYPAYNVGTYSQESIVTTKDGIYFHHSSGFYKFAYDSQPVEISRRVIDFIQAIPRSNYEEIKGIYNGFDAVEWAVGAVTVEGVTFTNCVMRYTISTQVWTIYDYPLNYITAMIQFDDATDLNMIMGTDEGKVLKMDDGFDDLGVAIYYELIDRWRSFTEMYAEVKSISGVNIYNQNAAGAKVMYQIENSQPNVWKDIGDIDEQNNSLIPNTGTDDFNVVRLRVAGFTKGTPVVFHGIELLSINVKGYDQN